MRNAKGQWVPSIPYPLFVGFRLRKAVCECGRKFKSQEAYEGHYALKHILLGVPTKKKS
ncbi:MAG: hypothetical protein KGL39_04450 [Patescibacteria group bacterium]|nr:hypothetical protein [Patescibacteria group bacterium]